MSYNKIQSSIRFLKINKLITILCVVLNTIKGFKNKKTNNTNG